MIPHRKRVLLAGLFHETNTFLEGRTSLHDFAILLGRQLFDVAGDASPLAGVVEAAERLDWELIPLVDCRAMPGPIVATEVIETFWREYRARAEPELQRGIDGIYLVLHGAMVSEGLDDVEGELLERIRKLRGAEIVPICGVLDLHANFTEKMARLSNGLIAYRENPHADAKQVAVASADLLHRLMNPGERARTVCVHPPVMWPPTGTWTAAEPMKILESAARKIERNCPRILAVNVCAGFPFSDTPATGVSFTAVTTGSASQAGEQLQRLASLAIQNKEKGNCMGMDLESAMAKLADRRKGPILLVEASDNIGAGAPGDGTPVLRAFLEHKIKNAALIINDPQAVSALQTVQPGGRKTLAIGGKGSRLDPGPVTLEAKLLSKSHGRFDLEDPKSHLASMLGRRIDMGSCAVVRHAGITILLTSRKTPPFDLGQWRSQGIEPEKFFAIGVKAAVAHRRAYDPIARASFLVDTVGPCSGNLKRLPFQNINRPIYPLDEIKIPVPSTKSMARK